MRIKRIGNTEICVSNEYSLHNYFAWPTIERLKNGNIALGSSGYRLKHVCPFGKGTVALSFNDGKTFTQAFPVIDTSLDDRDTGLCAFGESGLIVTSMNNTSAFQRSEKLFYTAYNGAYLDTISPEREKNDLGSNFRISFDNGITYGPIYKSPVHSPHGPIELLDGTILWVGSVYDRSGELYKKAELHVYSLNTKDGTMEHIGHIENIVDSQGAVHSCEAYAVELPDGKLVCHIRGQRTQNTDFTQITLYQSESYDKGFTWTKPHQIIPDNAGAPSHLILHSSGTLICTYGCRKAPYAIKAMLSLDGGETWSEPEVISECKHTPDMGYPASVELCDGSILTVFYNHLIGDETPSVIMKQNWKLEK